jgi:hypothetical protein
MTDGTGGRQINRGRRDGEGVAVVSKASSPGVGTGSGIVTTVFTALAAVLAPVLGLGYRRSR